MMITNGFFVSRSEHCLCPVPFSYLVYFCYRTKAVGQVATREFFVIPFSLGGYLLLTAIFS